MIESRNQTKINAFMIIQLRQTKCRGSPLLFECANAAAAAPAASQQSRGSGVCGRGETVGGGGGGGAATPAS